MNEESKPFVRAILYADIFDFPLTKGELWRFAVGKRTTKKDYEHFLKNLPKFINNRRGYFYLAKREAIVERRLRLQKVSKRKLLLAQTMAGALAKIPTIQLIGISGGLALLNADTHDDIDFFIVAKKNTIWTTRFFVTILLELYGKRRKRIGSNVSDRICVNMYLDEYRLQLSKKRHDLYTAHEVVQVVPLFDRQGTYEKFVKTNNWVSEFLPNAFKHGTNQNYTRNNTESWFSVVLCTALSSSVFEQSAKLFQQLYMRRHRTREVISDTILAFHPIDYRGKTLSAFAKQVRTYEKV